MVECSTTNYVVVGSNLVGVIQTSDIAPVSSKEFLDTQGSLERRSTLKCVCDMIITYSHLVIVFESSYVFLIACQVSLLWCLLNVCNLFQV